MKPLKLLIIIAMISSCTSCGVNSRKEVRESEENQMLCGGYTEQREITEDEMNLFHLATDGEDLTLTPLSVSTQVVAGVNYKFWCRFEDSARSTSGHCWVIIYQDLEGNVTLSSITEEE